MDTNDLASNQHHYPLITLPSYNNKLTISLERSDSLKVDRLLHAIESPIQFVATLVATDCIGDSIACSRRI
jgi:hypothetical protein